MSKPSRSKKKPRTERDPVEVQRERDIARAQERLGPTVDDRCRWILDEFTARDPSTLAIAERDLWLDNLQALAIGPHGGGAPRVIHLPGLWAARYYPVPPGLPEGTQTPLRGRIDAELSELWRMVGALTLAHRVNVPLPQLAATFGRVETAESGESAPYIRLGRHLTDKQDFRVAVIHAVVDLLSACERLRECPECKRLFVARRRQERHPKCARQARDRRRPSRAKKGA